MNTTHRRRGRRSLAAILAAMLMASVLAVVTGSPAQAANTSEEALVDHDGDAGTDDVREFGGRDRYDTALRLANNFGESKGLGNVPVAFVASGYKLVDAVSVAGLAGFLDAPILLTQSDSLHGGVADFIEDYGVDTVYVLGGPGAVADSVLEEMEALANEPTVSRIDGADRYETAARAASQLGGGAAWCGGEDPAAILANGGDVSLVDAMMAGPIAHRLQLPLLLTAADELPAKTAEFIEAEDIEHVVIVGNTDAVSDDVANALSDAGVDTVERIGEDSAAATSVELAGLLTGDCADDLAPSSSNTVALVSMDGLPDGVAAAPVLSSTYAGGDLVPMLIVGDTLPASVRDYLAATPESVGGNKLNLNIVAIGGNAAVSDDVMQTALDAAASADALTVQIGASEDKNEDGKTNADDAPAPGDMTVTLYFSDIVIQDDPDTATNPVARLTNAIRDILEINGAPARLSSVGYAPGARESCDAGKVEVTLSSPLKAKDTISVVAGAKLGANKDAREVGATSLTVASPAPDRSRPSVSVILIEGQGTGYVSLTDNGKPFAGPIETDDVTVRLGTGATRPLGAYTDAQNTAVEAVGAVTDGDIVLTSPATFTAGDRVTIAAGALEDAAKNKSLQRSFTAIRAQASPRITSVIMSNLNHSANAAIAVPDEITSGDGNRAFNADGSRNNGDQQPDVFIQAKADGAAAGAAGNTWSVEFDRASTYDANKDLDIDVRVNSRDQTVSVRFNNGKATFADLKAALEANSAFDAMFEVVIDPTIASLADGACGAAANKNPLAISGGTESGDSGSGIQRGSTRVTLAGGETKVAIRVTFNGYVLRVGDDGSEYQELLADVLGTTVARVKGKGTNIAGDTAVATTETDAEALTRVRGKLTLTELVNTPDDDTDTDNVAFGAPGTTVQYTGVTMDASALPQVRDLVDTDAGRDEDSSVTPNIEAIAPVAVGYVLADNPDTAAKEDENAASQVRINRSSSVPAPK